MNFCQLEEDEDKHAAADAHGKQVHNQLTHAKDKQVRSNMECKILVSQLLMQLTYELT